MMSAVNDDSHNGQELKFHVKLQGKAYIMQMRPLKHKLGVWLFGKDNSACEQQVNQSIRHSPNKPILLKIGKEATFSSCWQ